jgi:taurine dioxygenase
MAITMKPLADQLSFGARISGVDVENLRDEAVRRQINEVFTERGVIVFEDVEPSNRMQLALSDVFGPLQDHALGDVPRAEGVATGVVEFEYKDIFEINGKELSGYVPWHFDACYTKELNRGGILRALVIAEEGGLTGFADGIQLYDAVDPALRGQFEDLNIIYHSHLMFMNQRFGMPASYRPIHVRPMINEKLEATRDAPRADHPASWRRPNGEKVLHVAPWQAAGIEGMETPEGDALLEALIREIEAKMIPYFHQWKPTDMVIWDNWRFVHAASGNPPQHPRQMRRTTIEGDYGLGRFEEEGAESPIGFDV